MKNKLFDRIQGNPLPATALALCALLSAEFAVAEGSWQFGLNEGANHAQALLEYDSIYASPDTGLRIENRPLYVDIIDTAEVINVSVCGRTASSTPDAVSVEIWNEDGSIQLLSSAVTNNACADDFSGPITPGISYPGPSDPALAEGSYQVRLFNNSANDEIGVLERFDISVSSGSVATVNPSSNQGRLWAYRWAFRCQGSGCFGAGRSTSANLYAVVDGGFSDTYYVWQLNLDNFAGYAYELTANSIGLDSPNPLGTVVAGLSTCIDADDNPSDGCSSVSGDANSVSAVYPIYVADPAIPYPRPTEPPRISNFRFLDDAGVDDTISPTDTPMVQDTGDFLFTTNLITQGTYRITIDLTQDGSFGAGDVVLNGIALPNDNSVRWNGFDNSGNPIPNGSYNAEIQLKTGEFHFTAADAETSGGRDGSGNLLNDGLTINAVLDDGTVDTSNLVYWDDETVLLLSGPGAYNADGLSGRYHNWGTFSGSGDGNRAYIDTYVIGAFAAPVVTRLDIEPTDVPKEVLLGSVFEDLDGDGIRDPGEPGIANVIIAITEAGTGDTFFVTTDSNGDYQYFTFDSQVTVDVDESTLPAGYTRTAGTDPEIIDITSGVPNDAGLDGFRATRGPVSGEVRLDSDGNGDLSDPDSGIVGVTVELYSDPNGDGDPVDGVLIDSVLTAADGSYTFSDVGMGNFVVVETDPAGHTSSGEADGVSDNRIAVTRTANDPVNDVIFLDTLAASSITIDAQAVCELDAPYVDLDIAPVNFTPNNPATVEWIGADGRVVRTDTNVSLSGARLLWPEAAVNGDGRGEAWPGWAFDGTTWILVPTEVRPQVTLRVSVNPTAEVTIDYPPATPDCATNPAGFRSDGRPISGASAGAGAATTGSHSIPVLPLPMLLMLIGMIGATAYRFAPRQ